MATNFKQVGDVLDLTLSAAVSSGDPVMAGDIAAVALADIAAAGTGPCRISGVFDLAVEAVNDAGNSAVAVGDRIYYTSTDTIVLNKKTSGAAFGYALEAITSGSNDTINVLLVSGNSDALADDYIKQTKLDRDFIFEEFESQPVSCLASGGAPLGTTGTTNLMQFEENNFEYHVKGTQTILAPVIAAGGLNVGMDQTDNDGVEITNGITARSRAAFVVGTSPAFYAKCTFTITTVAGTDDCAFGFRKAEAYQAAIDDYDEMACLNVISGNINIETILNAGDTSTTDTTDDWADGESHTLEVYVSAAGVVTYKIDGAAPSETATFTFDDDEVVVPFFYMLQANASQTGAVYLTAWEVGLQ